MQNRNSLWVLGVLFIFTVITAVRHFGSPGEDLSSSYYSCRLLAAHQDAHLYSRDPSNYSAVADPMWVRLARQTGFTPLNRLHPFVQTPLWAYSLEPLCTRMEFPAFNKLFLCILSLCLSCTIWLVARFWAPATFHPGWIAVVCAALYLSETYKNAMVFTQTHVIFIFLTIAALVLARGKHFVWAGAFLALAAAVKITPGLLLIYWLLVKKWRAAVSFVVFSAVLAILSIVTTGWALNLTYLHNLAQISNMLLVSANNQSLAALWMAPSYPYSETQAWHFLALPPVVKWTCALLSILCVAMGGVLDQRSKSSQAEPAPPYGAAFAMLGATMFATVAWTHYYILLVFPMMLMLNAILQKRSPLILAIMLVVVALNFDMATMGGVLHRFQLFPIMRAQFFSGLVCMAGLVTLSIRQRMGNSATFVEG